jgi:hypothetical protein
LFCGAQTPVFHAIAHPAAPTTQTPTMLRAFLTRAAATTGLRVATVAAREADVAGVAAAEERCFDAIGAAGRGLALAARVLEVVVDALRNEDQVREAEVDCECDDGGHETGPDSADEIGDIADKPDGEEGKRDALGGALFVVFDQLRDLRWVSWGERQVACVCLW